MTAISLSPSDFAALLEIRAERRRLDEREADIWDRYQNKQAAQKAGSPLTPPKPNIALAQAVIPLACIDVREATPTIITSWGLTSRENTPFVRNLPDNSIAAHEAIGIPSRDVNVNNTSFWCIQGIGAYDHISKNDNDFYPGVGWLGSAAVSAGVFLMYNETIRDACNTVSDITRTVSEIQQVVALHEILHLFGFIHNPNTDGEVMGIAWQSTPTMPPAVLTLSSTQIRKIQARDYPR